MRKSLILETLFPDVRGRILAATLMRPDKRWYLSELAKFLHAGPSSLQREINGLSKAGILKQWRDGRRVYLQPDTESPVFRDLKSLFDKTAGLVPVLQQALESFGDKISLAFVHGSVARSEEQSGSDVDLLVVGAVGLGDLVPVLRASEQALGRPINSTVFAVVEFGRKAKGHDHFLSTVLSGAKVFVKGSEHDLERLTGEG